MSSLETQFGEGNQAARKYTLEKAIEIFEDIEQYIREDESVIFLNQPCNALGYYGHLPRYLLRAHKQSMELQELAMRIYSLLEERIVVGAMTGRLKETSCIFVLKTQFGYKETQHVEVNKTVNEVKQLQNADKQKLEDIEAQLLAIKQGNDAGTSQEFSNTVE